MGSGSTEERSSFTEGSKFFFPFLEEDLGVGKGVDGEGKYRFKVPNVNDGDKGVESKKDHRRDYFYSRNNGATLTSSSTRHWS